MHSVNVTWLRTHARIPTHPVKVGEVGVLGLQALRPHEAREHLDRHRGDHVVAPVGVRRGVVAPRRKDGRDLLQTQQRKKKDSRLRFHRMQVENIFTRGGGDQLLVYLHVHMYSATTSQAAERWWCIPKRGSGTNRARRKTHHKCLVAGKKMVVAGVTRTGMEKL